MYVVNQVTKPELVNRSENGGDKKEKTYIQLKELTNIYSVTNSYSHTLIVNNGQNQH